MYMDLCAHSEEEQRVSEFIKGHSNCNVHIYYYYTHLMMTERRDYFDGVPQNVSVSHYFGCLAATLLFYTLPTYTLLSLYTYIVYVYQLASAAEAAAAAHWVRVLADFMLPLFHQ